MPQPPTKTCLSAHDQQVLESIFNPLELTSSLQPHQINPDAAASLQDNEQLLGYAQEILKQSKILEIEAVQLAEEQKLDEALEKFSAALTATPERAAVYNNRAQTLRLAGRDEEAFADLNKAIACATDKEQLKTKCHALCQRGVLYRKQEKLDEARADFEEASKMGSKFAQTQLVELNPFAALCNQMLRQAFEQLQK